MITDALDRELALGDAVVSVHVVGSRAHYDCGVVTGFTKNRVKVARFHPASKYGAESVSVSDRQGDKLLIMREETFAGTPWEEAIHKVRAHERL